MSFRKRALKSQLFLFMLTVAMLSSCRHAGKHVLTVSAAASLTGALEELAPQFTRLHPEIDLRLNFGASGALAQQIAQGAPVDLFLSASEKNMDGLDQQHLLVAGSRRDLLQNKLVLVTPLGSNLSGFAGLADKSVHAIAVGDPVSVPAGEYAAQTFAALGLAKVVQGRLVLARDVRQVLTYVEQGEADAGMVYASDAAGSARVRVAADAPEQTHQAIRYPMGVIGRGQDLQDARTLEEFLESESARTVFVRHGFTMAQRR